MDLNEVLVFIQVVQEGSFTKAARVLGMPNSTVSSKVSALEKRLGLTLIQRTTRQLHVTPAGEAYYKRALAGFEQIRSAEDEVLATQGEPQGLLRITAPNELGMTVLPDIVTDFLSKYQKVRVDIVLTDRRLDLLADGIDLAIRAGELKDSTLVAKKLGAVAFSLYTSSKYLKRKGAPKKPSELNEHETLPFTHLGTESWKLTDGKSNVTVKLNPRAIVNEFNVGKSLAMAGAGIALLPTFFCRKELEQEKLVNVLPEWRTSHNPVHFVYPAQRYVLPKVEAFIRLATEPIRRSLS